MTQKKTTADKSNAYKIQSRISQSIFREFVEQQVGEQFKNTAVARFDRPMLSSLANVATRAIMNESRLDVVLKKKG